MPLSSQPHLRRVSARLLSGMGRTWLLLACTATLPLLLFGGWAGYLSAVQTRTNTFQTATMTADMAAERIVAELAHQLALLRVLAASPALDRLDLPAFRPEAERVRAQQPLWHTVELALPAGAQLLNLLRPPGAPLGRTADQPSLDAVVRTGRAVVGGIGPLGPVSGQRLVTLRAPVARDGALLAVLSAALAPDGIDILLRRAGAPDAWVGVVVDASGHIVARTRAVAGDGADNPLASPTLRAAIAATPDGQLHGRTREGVAVETVYRSLAGSDGWVVAFGIPAELLEAPVRRAMLLLAASGAVGLLLAALLTSLVAHELAQHRANEAERAGRSLRAAEDGRALAVEAAELGVWRWRAASALLDASPRCWALLGLDPPAGTRRAWRYALAAIHPADRAALLGAVRRSLRGGTLDAALRVGDAEPPVQWVRVTGRPVDAPGEEGFVMQGVIADISRSKRREAERRDLLRAMAQGQEEERRRVARDLHDQIGQTVTGLSLGLRTLEARLAGADPGVDERLAWLRCLAAGIGQDIHRAAADLRPAALDDFGLLPALAALAAEWRARHGMLVDVQAVGTVDRLPPEIETAIFRAVQEALTNALKHARARTVSVLLERRTDGLRLIVEDDGDGFDPEAAPPDARPRLGLSGMRERLQMVGGALEVESAPGHGTTLFVTVPYRLPRAPAADAGRAE